MNAINIKNLVFRYNNKFIFDNFNLTIKKGTLTLIAGPNGSGKTTLVKILSGIEKNYADITFFEKKADKKSLSKLIRDVAFVFDNPDNFFVCETVEDELAFSLENLAITPDVIRKKLKYVSKLLKIENILKSYPMDLSGGEKQKVLLACALMLEPKIIILDDSFMMVDKKERNEILKILSMYNKEKRVTILYLTSTLEDYRYFDRIIILNNGKIVLDGENENVFEEENIIRKIGLDVPFSIELSKKLKILNVISDLNSNLDKVVDDLWK